MVQNSSCVWYVTKFWDKLSVASQLPSAYIKRKISVTNFSSENNLSTFRLNAPVVITFSQMPTGAFSRKVSKLFSELKLVTSFGMYYIYVQDLENC